MPRPPRCMRTAIVFALAGVVLAPLPSLRSRTRSQTHVVREHYTLHDQQARRYVYVPIDVPAGTTRIDVSYRYDGLNGANVVDLGLYEPGSLELGTTALRGWSGGSRREISVGESSATPGYWPGRIPAGEWHVALGLYKVDASGVDVEVTATTSSVPDARATTTTSAADAANEPLRRGAAWYAGVLHAHTVHSDGTLTTAALEQKAVDERLDFLAITDHNNTTHQLDQPARRDLLVIRGEEVTTPGGHFNVWGLGTGRVPIEFRILPGNPLIDRVIAGIAATGALVGVNHPTADCAGCGWTHAIPAAVRAMEIANGTPAARAQALAIWDTLWRSGRRLVAVGGSDWHGGTAPLSAVTERVWADELSSAALLDGIRRGRVVVVAGATRPTPEFTAATADATARVGDTITIAAGDPVRFSVHVPAGSYADARVVLVIDGEAADVRAVDAQGDATFDRVVPAEAYVRIHVIESSGAPIAVTNPIVIHVR